MTESVLFIGHKMTDKYNKISSLKVRSGIPPYGHLGIRPEKRPYAFLPIYAANGDIVISQRVYSFKNSFR